MKNYFAKDFFFDLKAGFITAVVALPLALAFAIASGVEPKIGLLTAIVAGVIGSLAGGSRFSITGPTGAMTVVILAVVNRFGFDGLLVAGFLAGVIQILLSVLRMGEVVSFIPLPVVSGFTSGIGAIIFIGQLPNFFGLRLPPKEHVWDTLHELFQHSHEINSAALMIAVLSLLSLLIFPALLARHERTKNIPASIVVLIAATIATALFQLDIPQVGEIPRALPPLEIPNWNFEMVKDLLPSAFTIALLGSIESLLCAVVCDGMSGTKHDSNRELLGQGLSNVTLPFIGGMPATAAIARSAINIREGARSKWAGVFHALILLATVLAFSGAAQNIPKAFLAAILMIVSARMINVHELRAIWRISMKDGLVLVVTLALTVFTNLVFAVQVGMLLAIFLLFVKLMKLVDVSSAAEYDSNEGLNAILQADPLLSEHVSLYTLHGPFFFGAMSVFERKVREHINVSKKIVVLRMRLVPFIDSTGVERLRDFIHERRRQGKIVLLSGLASQVEGALRRDPELSHLFADHLVFGRSRDALEGAKKLLS